MGNKNKDMVRASRDWALLGLPKKEEISAYNTYWEDYTSTCGKPCIGGTLFAKRSSEGVIEHQCSFCERCWEVDEIVKLALLVQEKNGLIPSLDTGHWKMSEKVGPQQKIKIGRRRMRRIAKQREG